MDANMVVGLGGAAGAAQQRDLEEPIAIGQVGQIKRKGG